MNWLDWLIVGVFGYFMFLGYRKGLVQQLFDVIGSVVALILAFKYYRQFGTTLAGIINFSEVFTNVLGFILIVVMVSGAVSFMGKRWHAKRKERPSALVDNGCGAIFGAVKAAVILIMVLLVLLSIPWSVLQDQIGASVLAGDLLRLTPLFYQLQEKTLPEEFPRMVISPEGLSFRNLNYSELEGATCIRCGGKVKYQGLVKQGLISYPQFICEKCKLVSDGCLTFEGHHMLKGECPYERLMREHALECKIWGPHKSVPVKGRCPVCGRTE